MIRKDLKDKIVLILLHFFPFTFVKDSLKETVLGLNYFWQTTEYLIFAPFLF